MDKHQLVMESLAVLNGFGILVLLLKNLLDMRKHRLEISKLEHEVHKLTEERSGVIKASQDDLREFVLEPFARALSRAAECFDDTHLRLIDTMKESVAETEKNYERSLGYRNGDLLRVISENTEVQRELPKLLRQHADELLRQHAEQQGVISENTQVQRELLQLLRQHAEVVLTIRPVGGR